MQTVALVGRPNVGKSSLFNILLGQRVALVDQQAGVTRDRHPRPTSIEDRHFILVDTAGIVAAENEMESGVQKQSQWAIEEADAIIFVLDYSTGVMPDDYEILNQLQRSGKPFALCLNKCDLSDDSTQYEFFKLPAKHVVSTSALRRQRINTLKQLIYDWIEPSSDALVQSEHDRIAIIGRPNAGKSTLVNYLARSETVVVSNQAGTTTDSIDINILYKTPYTLVDTAGIRRKNKIKTQFEHACILKSLRAISSANVVFYVIDASCDITEQDCKLLGTVVESGKPCIILVNKWDILSDYDQRQINTKLMAKLRFVDYLPQIRISAAKGTGIHKAFSLIRPLLARGQVELATSRCTELLEQAQEVHQPPLVNGRRIRLRYAHLISNDPVVIMIHGKQVSSLPESYQKYLARFYRDALGLDYQQVIIRFKNDHNPYVND